MGSANTGRVRTTQGQHVFLVMELLCSHCGDSYTNLHVLKLLERYTRMHI